jgi:hypothetical protein
MKYIEYICYFITYLERAGRTRRINECIGTSEMEEVIPGHPMEKSQEYPMYYH